MDKKVLKTTLVFLFKESKVLLGMKKRGFGQGKWNGFGGKIQPGESLTAAARRELKEECNLEVEESDLEQFALLKFQFEGDDPDIEVNVFKTKLFHGVEKESDEMRPYWFDFHDIPFSKMWADDKLWFPLMFENKSFAGKFLFRGHSTILDYSLKEMPISEFENYD